MRIVFAGSPAAAVPSLNRLLASPHEVAAVITREDSPVGRRGVLTPTPVAVAAAEAGLMTIKADRLDAVVTDRVADLRPDLGVIVAYGGLVREPLLSGPRLGWINVHFSLLPRWRGAAPVQRAIIAGDDSTGVTVFRLVPELDAGDVLGAVAEPIGALQTAGSLLERLAEVGASLLGEVIDDLESGRAAARPQLGEPTFAPKLSAADGRLRLDEPASAVHARFRGVTPEPGAFLDVQGTRLKVLDAAVARETAPIETGRIESRGGAVLVGTATDPIELIRVLPAGRNAMDAAAWWRGFGADGPVHAS